MDQGRPVRSSRKRSRAKATASRDHIEAAEGSNDVLPEELTPDRPAVKRSRSAIRRENKKKRASIADPRQEQTSLQPTLHPENSAHPTHHSGPVSRVISPPPQGTMTDEDAMSGTASKTGLKASGSSRSSCGEPEDEQSLNATSPIVPPSDSAAVDATSIRSSTDGNSASAFGGARAAMRARDQEAAKAAAIAEAEARAISIHKAKEEEEATRRAQQQALTDTQRALRNLELEFEKVKAEGRIKDQLILSQSSALTYLYGQASCAICLELAFRPHVLSPCGHTFCARCLIDWFQRPADGESVDIPSSSTPMERRAIEISATRRRKKICPHCRGDVSATPAEVWSMKGMIDRLDLCHKSGQFAVEGSSEHPPLTAQEERQLRGLDLANGGALWEDIFDSRPVGGPVYDEADGVFRCGRCTSEVVGNECCSCGAIYSELDGIDEDFEDGSLDGRSDEFGDFSGHEVSPDSEDDSMGSFIDDGDLPEGGPSAEEVQEYADRFWADNAPGRGHRTRDIAHDVDGRRYGYSSDEGEEGSGSASEGLAGFPVTGHAFDDEHWLAEDTTHASSVREPRRRRQQERALLDSEDEEVREVDRGSALASSTRRRPIVVASDSDADHSDNEHDSEDADEAEQWLDDSEQDFSHPLPGHRRRHPSHIQGENNRGHRNAGGVEESGDDSDDDEDDDSDSDSAGEEGTYISSEYESSYDEYEEEVSDRE